MTGEQGVAAQLVEGPVHRAAGGLKGVTGVPIIGQQMDAQFADCLPLSGWVFGLVRPQAADADKGSILFAIQRVILQTGLQILLDFPLHPLLRLTRRHGAGGRDITAGLLVGPKPLGQRQILQSP